MAEKEYVTQFTKDNILALKGSINEAINAHAEKNVEGQKLDLFLILAALGQSAYEVVLRTLPKSEEDAKKNVDEMKVIVDKFIKVTDDTRGDLHTKPASELAAAAHLLSVVAEFYSRRRDDVITQLIQEKEAEQTVVSTTPEVVSTEDELDGVETPIKEEV